MIKNILCYIGFHKYRKTKESTYNGYVDELLGIQSQEAERKCCRCDKQQKLYIHVLGLNPPEYANEWIDNK